MTNSNFAYFGIRKIPKSHRKMQSVCANSPKPVILHSIRIALYLNNLGYNRNIVLAAILHDILEDSSASVEKIK